MDESVCTYCKKHAVRKPHTWNVRRGDRFVKVQADYWECISNCMGPDGVQPFSWLGPLLMKDLDDKAEKTWMEIWGESIPKTPRFERKRNGKP